MRCKTDGCGNYLPDGVDRCGACEAGYVMVTADRVKITDGLAVWTNDLESGRVDLTRSDPRQDGWPPSGEFWFYVKTKRGSHLQSESRVATVHPFTRVKAEDDVDWSFPS